MRLYLRGGTEPLAKGALADLPRLRELDLSERALAAVPEEVFALPSLERFWFARNQLAECPAALAKLPALTYPITLGSTATVPTLTAVPEALGDAARLRYLRLNENQLADLPAALGRLKELRRFYAVRNRLTAVPAFLKECPLVEDVILDHNAITEVPAWLTALPALRSVSLTGCRIAKLPDDLSGWRKLEALSLAGCPIPADEMKRIRKALGDDVAVTF